MSGAILTMIGVLMVMFIVLNFGILVAMQVILISTVNHLRLRVPIWQAF